MTPISAGFVPTERLRFEKRTVPDGSGLRAVMILQQWYTIDAPNYMRGNEGEWRDVECVEAVAP